MSEYTGPDSAGRTAPILISVVRCPRCGEDTEETMPVDACQVIFDCGGCGAALRPLKGDCCIFCSYGSVPCPPMQEQG